MSIALSKRADDKDIFTMDSRQLCESFGRAFSKARAVKAA
jgi:hypothetical protein